MNKKNIIISAFIQNRVNNTDTLVHFWLEHDHRLDRASCNKVPTPPHPRQPQRHLIIRRLKCQACNINRGRLYLKFIIWLWHIIKIQLYVTSSSFKIISPSVLNTCSTFSPVLALVKYNGCLNSVDNSLRICSSYSCLLNKSFLLPINIIGI